MVQILYLIQCGKLLTKVIVYMFPLIYICLDFVWTRNVFPLNHYVLEVQNFCQWIHYDNLWKIKTY